MDHGNTCRVGLTVGGEAEGARDVGAAAQQLRVADRLARRRLA